MKVLTNSVDELPVLVSGLPASTPVEVVVDPQAEDIRFALGIVKGYKGDACKTLSPRQIVTGPQAILFLGPIDPGLELGKDWVIWEGQDISFKKGGVIALDIESVGGIDNDAFVAGRLLSVALWNGKFGSAELIGLVHDATYVECPEETVEECSRMMEREMSKAATLVFNRVPFVSEAEVGNNWEEV